MPQISCWRKLFTFLPYGIPVVENLRLSFSAFYSSCWLAMRHPEATAAVRIINSQRREPLLLHTLAFGAEKGCGHSNVSIIAIGEIHNCGTTWWQRLLLSCHTSDDVQNKERQGSALSAFPTVPENYTFRHPENGGNFEIDIFLILLHLEQYWG